MRTDDIVRQRFAKVFRGYDVQEVDLFLDDVIREMDRLEQERNSLLIRLEALLQELDRCDKLLHDYQAKEKALAEAERAEPVDAEAVEIVVQPEELTELQEEVPAVKPAEEEIEETIEEATAEQKAEEALEEAVKEAVKEAVGEAVEEAVEEKPIEKSEEEAVEEAAAQPPSGDTPHEA